MATDKQYALFINHLAVLATPYPLIMSPLQHIIVRVPVEIPTNKLCSKHRRHVGMSHYDSEWPIVWSLSLMVPF